VGLNKQEKQALYGQTPFVRWMYEHGIREYMDYATGIVGVARRISYQSLKEEMYVEPESGIPKTETGNPTTNKIIRAISRLERLGLLKRIDERPLVFECVLANRDNSAQKQVGARQVSHSGTQAGIKKSRINPATERHREENRRQVGAQADSSKITQAGTPPLSVKDNINTNVFILSENDETIRTIFEIDFWQHYPKEFRAKKKEAFEVFKKKKLYEIKDTIRDDICVRKEKHRPWKDGYVPHPTTYLRGERWTDELQEVSGNGGGKYRKGNGKGESIEAILDSCFQQSDPNDTEINGEFTRVD
jgi:hypothetical protein